MENVLNTLHYVVESLAIVGITVITVAYMTVGGFDTPIILGAFAAITAIAGVESYRKVKEGKS